MEHFIEWLAYPFVGNWVCDCCHATSISVVMNDTGETIAGMKSRCWCFGYFLCSDMPPIGSKRQAASQDSADQAGAERLSQAEREVSSVAYLGKALDLCRKYWICAESVHGKCRCTEENLHSTSATYHAQSSLRKFSFWLSAKPLEEWPRARYSGLYV